MAYKKVFDANKATREEWLEFRKSGIGGSDMAAILGLSNYRSALDVWMDKTGRTIPSKDDGNRFTYWGTKLESIVADEFAIRTGYSVRNNNFTLQSVEYPFLLANIDREIVGVDAGLECKTASAFKVDEWQGDSVPDAYYIQCQHYMAVTGKASWWIAALVGGNDYYYKEIPRNDNVIEAIIEAAQEFWSFVLTDTMPAVDGSDSCQEALRQLYSNTQPESIQLEDSADIYAEAYLKAKADKKDAEERAKEAQNNLCQLLANNEVGYTNKHKITWKYRKAIDGFDKKGLAADYPDIFSKYVIKNEPSRTQFSCK